MGWNSVLALAYATTLAATLWRGPPGGVLVGVFWLAIFAFRIADDDPPWCTWRDRYDHHADGNW